MSATYLIICLIISIALVVFFLYKSKNESGNRTYSWFSASRSTDQGAAQ